MADLVFTGKATDGIALNSSAMPRNHDMVIYKGDYVELFFSVTDDSHAPIDLDGYTAKASLKTTFSDPLPVVFTCTVTNVLGQVRIYLPSAQSRTLVPGSYVWDFEVTNATGDTRTYLAGDVVVYPEVTTAP